MFPSNQDPSIGDYIKSINHNPIINNNASNDMFTSNNLNFPLLSNNNNGISNSTSTSANLQIPSNTSWNFNTPDSQQQQLNFYDNGLQVALSNTTNTNFGNVNSALEQVILNVFQNRGRSQSAGNMQTSTSLGFSPTLSNNQSSFAPQSNSFVQMSSSLPNTQASTPSFVTTQQKSPFNQQPNLSFQQPFTIVSDYKVSSTSTDQDSNNLNNSNNQTNVANDALNIGLHKMITEMMVSNPNPFNFGQLGQQSNSFNNSPTNNQIFIQPPPQQPQIQTNQPMNNTNFSPILNSLLVNQPPSPNQIVFNNNSMQSVSPTSSNSPPTQPFTTMSIMPSSSTTLPSSNSTPNSSVPKSTSGKQLRQRSVSCSSSSNPYQSSSTTPPQFIINPPITFCNQDSPKKGNRKSGIKFAIDFMDNAQQFDTKHTSLTPSTMKQHIAERDERERSGVKKRGRPKGSGVKQQVTRGGKLLFYQNCYNSVEVLYKDKRNDPGRDDDESGFTV